MKRGIFTETDDKEINRRVLAYNRHARRGPPVVGEVIRATLGDGKSVIYLVDPKQNGILYKTVKVREIG